MVQVYHIKNLTVNPSGQLRDKGAKLYHMNKKQEANAFVKECITTALIQKMKTTHIDEITITDLISKAGVSRNSFYRNFDSKRDILEKHLLILIQEWGKEFEDRGDIHAFSETLLKHYYKHRDFYLLLYQQGLSSMIYENLRTATKLKEASSNPERYGKSMFAGMLFGWLDEWMRQGMPESPEELILLTAQLNQN